SETAKNTSPIPIPAVNSIANHDNVPYSGVESEGPSRILPCRDIITTNTNTTNPVAAKIYSQSKLVVMNPFTASATADTLPGAITPHNTNATVNSADTTNTGGFVCSRRYCRTDEPAEDSTAGSSEPAESRC